MYLSSFASSSYAVKVRTVSQKNVTALSCHNFDFRESILIIFGRIATQKVSLISAVADWMSSIFPHMVWP